MGVTRRTALSAGLGVAAGAVAGGTGIAGAAAADPPADAVDPAELEARALALQPPVFLFETAVPAQLQAGAGSRLDLAAGIAAAGGHSLRWRYRPGSTVTIAAPLRNATPVPEAGRGDQAFLGTVDTFAVWLYNEHPVDDAVRVEFGRGGGTDAWFEVRLGFRGWRTIWVRYGDLAGHGRADMDTVRLVAPRRAGTLYLDQLMLNVPLRPDHPTPDEQVPFVNPEVDDADNAHWLALLSFQRLLDGNPQRAGRITAAERAALATVRRRYHDEYLAATVTVTDEYVSSLADQVTAYGVPESGSTGGGRPLLSHQSEIYPAAIATDLTGYVDAVPLSGFTALMQKVAQAYDAAGSGLRDRLAALYLRMVGYLRDRGWQAGSCLGTIHHLGYDARGYYDSVYLMRDVLASAGLLAAVRADLDWLSGLGRMFADPARRQAHGGIMDIVNTTVRGMLAAVLLRDNDSDRIAYLRVLRDWLSAQLLPTVGIQDGIKVDGSVFHHVGAYPDYARDGFVGLAPMIAVLRGGAFRVGTEAHQRVKDALLTMRGYANQTQWPLSLTGRHPTGKTALSIAPYQTLAFAGTPDGRHDVDPELAAAFLRLLPAKPSTVQRGLAERLAALGITAEPAPVGNWTLNYAALAVHRRDEWLVAVRGHNRYLWCTEIYPDSNWYGRYSTYGTIQVLNKGNPVSNLDSGFSEPGWDWNRWPGTTTKHLPWSSLRADLTGAIEEMLLTDSRFGGALTIDGRNGMFAMLLHEHPKYDGTHRARKSVFLFDDRIVAVGTGIENDDAEHQTETTLFQSGLATPDEPTRLGGDEIRDLPYRRDLDSDDDCYLVDGKGIGYHVPAGQRLSLTRSRQQSRDQGTDLPTEGDFATAWLRHGSAPRDGSYRYAMVVGTTPERMAAFVAATRDPATAPYRVVRAGRAEHVVSDRATGLTGYAVFDPAAARLAEPVRAVDTPCLLMTRADGDGIVLAACDPDLRLYAGRDPDQYDAAGNFVGHVSPFSRPWVTNRSRRGVLRVTLTGRWRTTGDPAGVTVRPAGNDTAVSVPTVDGRPVQVRLARQ